MKRRKAIRSALLDEIKKSVKTKYKMRMAYKILCSLVLEVLNKNDNKTIEITTKKPKYNLWVINKSSTEDFEIKRSDELK